MNDEDSIKLEFVIQDNNPEAEFEYAVVVHKTFKPETDPEILSIKKI